MTFLDLVVLILAATRVTRLVVLDDFPLGQHPSPSHPNGTGLRKVWDSFAFDGDTDTYRGPIREWAGRLISCVWCAGVWVSALVYLFYAESGLSWAPALTIVLAVAGAQGLLQSWERPE